MVIPSRWLAGGHGLGRVPRRVCSPTGACARSSTIENATDVFPDVGLGGGICYFLWDRDNPGLCECTYHSKWRDASGRIRATLDEFDVFVRDKRAVDILQKVVAAGERPFDELVSGDTPFGLATNFTDYARDAAPRDGQVRLYANVGTKRVRGAMARETITKNAHLIDQWKVFLPVAGSGRERERIGVDLVLSPPFVGEPGTVCIGDLSRRSARSTSKAEAESVLSYLRTPVRSLPRLSAQAIPDTLRASVYTFVPTADVDQDVDGRGPLREVRHHRRARSRSSRR